jgi:hypothetical protein
VVRPSDDAAGTQSDSECTKRSLGPFLSPFNRIQNQPFTEITGWTLLSQLFPSNEELLLTANSKLQLQCNMVAMCPLTRFAIMINFPDYHDVQIK